MRPQRHFCGMAAAASHPSLSPRPGQVGRCRRLVGKGPMHEWPVRDSKGMDALAPQELP